MPLPLRGDHPPPPKPASVLILGSGPVVIGQAAEFDYAGTQACQSLREEGISVVIVLPAVSQIVRDFYTPEVEQRFQSHLSRLQETYPFEVVDLRDTVLDAGFSDHHHLNFDSGSLIYSRAALELVVMPAVERRGLAVSP